MHLVGEDNCTGIAEWNFATRSGRQLALRNTPCISIDVGSTSGLPESGHGWGRCVAGRILRKHQMGDEVLMAPRRLSPSSSLMPRQPPARSAAEIDARRASLQAFLASQQRLPSRRTEVPHAMLQT